MGLSIGDVEKITGISKDRLRYYEEKRLVCLHMILKILLPRQLTDLTPWSFVNRTIFPQSITESVFLPNN